MQRWTTEKLATNSFDEQNHNGRTHAPYILIYFKFIFLPLSPPHETFHGGRAPHVNSVTSHDVTHGYQVHIFKKSFKNIASKVKQFADVITEGAS